VVLQQPVQRRSQQAGQHQDHLLHLSLSRTVPIRHIQADSLRAALTRQLRPFRSFPLTLSGLTCLVNDTHSRTFVGIKAAVGRKHVCFLPPALLRSRVAICRLPWAVFWRQPVRPACSVEAFLCAGLVA
jgi:hypothetical protein